jgi:hypothetical protein
MATTCREFIVSLIIAVGAFASTTNAENAPQIPLFKLVTDRFRTLSCAEKRLVEKTISGETADCTDLSGDNKNIRGDLLSWLCTNSQATAQLTYRGISLVDAEIVNEMDLKWAKISFPISALKCTFQEAIDLTNSHLDVLNLAGSSVKQLKAKGARFGGSLFLDDRFKTEGGVDLSDVKIDGKLDCKGAELIGTETAKALNAENAEIKGSVDFSDLQAKGGVNLVAARIDGDLLCDRGHFVGKINLPALNLNSAEVKGGVLLRTGFEADGEVNLIAAKIGGNLEFDSAHLIGKGNTLALNADSTNVGGSVYFRSHFQTEGKIRFGASYAGGSFQWSNVDSPKRAALDLRYSKVRSLLNPADSWPDHLDIDGFIYELIDERSHPSDKVQLGWLSLQARNKFLPQPYEQLAAVLRKMGHGDDAKKVLIAENESEAKYIPLRFNRIGDWLWFKIIGPRIGYGYRPWNAFIFSLGVISIGWWLFRWGFLQGLLTPTSNEAYGTIRGSTHQLLESYPKFNAFIYSLETFVPLVKLGLGDHWTPNANRGRSLRLGIVTLRTGSLLRGYLWFHIIAGWVLTTLWVGGLTGLVKT